MKALRSITDVQWWLKNNEVVLSSSAETVRIREVVEALSTKPKPRQETIDFFVQALGCAAGHQEASQAIAGTNRRAKH